MRGRAEGKEDKQETWNLEALSQKTVQGSPMKPRPGLHLAHRRLSHCSVPGRPSLILGHVASRLLPFAKASSREMVQDLKGGTM